MAISQNVLTKIKNREYPHTARSTDPLIVRVSELSLLVNDTMFHAKVKNGLGCKGYIIYSSGLGIPIIERYAEISKNKTATVVSYKDETGKVKSGNLSDDWGEFFLDEARKEIDNIEKTIADQPSDNAIKKAIDRMCWQLHYDITESHTYFPDVFAENDFSDVQIDRYPMETEYWDGVTIKSSISNAAGVVYEGDPVPVRQIINKGYAYESSQELGALNTLVETFDENINNSISSLEGEMSSKIDKVAINIKADNDEYTISKALRDKESGDVSVSNQIKLQTDEIKSGLGPEGSISTSLGTIIDGIGSDGENPTGILGKLKSINSTDSEILSKIGVGYGQNSILGHLGNINSDADTIKSETTLIRMSSSNMENSISNISSILTNTHNVIDGKDCFRVYNSTTTW